YIAAIRALELALHFALDRLKLLLELGRSHHRSLARHRLELRPVDRHPLATDQLRLGTEAHEPPAYRLERPRIQAPELSNRLVIGHQTAEQPHHLHVAAALAFKPPGGANMVKITVEVKSKQIVRII